MAADASTVLLDLLRHAGPLPAGRVRETLGVSQATLSRLTRRVRGSIVQIGRARATLWAARREVGALGRQWPVHRVDAQGRLHPAAELHALHPRYWWYDAGAERPGWLHGEFAAGLFPDLPWFLDDLRPQGFLGRAFARRHGRALGLGDDPRLWSAEGVLTVLLQFGDDLPGDFVIGAVPAERVMRAALDPPAGVAVERRLDRYGELAEAALAGDVAGSSAGGEQPKFAVCVETAEGYVRRLVKFSPPVETPSGRRWADLLLCEHVAAEILRAHGVPAVVTALSDAGGRRFLEIDRFDRVGAHGRRGFVSLLALASGHGLALDAWPSAAVDLARDGWLSAEDADTLRLGWWFGTLIGNTDMHFANVSVALSTTRPLGLAPLYDMLPMHYRPTAGGEITTRAFEPALPPPLQRRVWARAAAIAIEVWRAVAGDRRVSEEFRAEAARVLEQTRHLADRLG